MTQKPSRTVSNILANYGLSAFEYADEEEGSLLSHLMEDGTEIAEFAKFEEAVYAKTNNQDEQDFLLKKWICKNVFFLNFVRITDPVQWKRRYGISQTEPGLPDRYLSSIYSYENADYSTEVFFCVVFDTVENLAIQVGRTPEEIRTDLYKPYKLMRLFNEKQAIAEADAEIEQLFAALDEQINSDPADQLLTDLLNCMLDWVEYYGHQEHAVAR